MDCQDHFERCDDNSSSLKSAKLTLDVDMNISVKETTVFAVFHPDAQDLYNTCSDLKKVAWELWDQTHRLNAQVSHITLLDLRERICH